MGTSSSGGGPGDTTPLLPSWALPNGNDDGDGDAMDASTEGVDGGGQSDGTTDADADDGGKEEAPYDGAEDVGKEPADGTVPQVLPMGVAHYWNSAKRQLGSAVTNRSGRTGISKAGRAYVRALGGSRNASRSATSARSATSRLGGFLSNVIGRGMDAALESLGLERYVGRDSNTVFAAIVDALAPEGIDLEEAATREAIQETLAGLFEQYVAPDGSMAALEAMTPEAVRSALEASVAASVFNRWLGDLAKKLEEKAVSSLDAVRLERDMGSYIRDTVKLDLQGNDPLRMDWGGAEGTQFVDRVYEEAYSILGGLR